MSTRLGKAFKNLLRDGSGMTYSRPVYEGTITDDVEAAIRNANALTPVRENMYIDPYMAAIRAVREMGISVRYEHTTRKVVA